ncbi:MAG: hypothetical protein ACKVJA_02035, partial [Flavobacteriales bacterium]
FTWNDACAKELICFTDLSNATTNGLWLWEWNFFDGPSGFSSFQNPCYNYPNVNPYLGDNRSVQLTITDSMGCQNDTIISGIEIWPIPIMRVISDSICEGEEPFEFEDQSGVNSNGPFGNSHFVTNRFWDFDGLMGIQTPIISWNAVLAGWPDTACINVGDEIELDFTSSPLYYDSMLITINDPIHASPLYYAQNNQNFNYLFDHAGIFGINITLWNGFGLGVDDYCVLEVIDSIRIYPEPIASFIPGGISGCEPLVIDFTDQSDTIDVGFEDHGGINYITYW